MSEAPCRVTVKVLQPNAPERTSAVGLFQAKRVFKLVAHFVSHQTWERGLCNLVGNTKRCKET